MKPIYSKEIKMVRFTELTHFPVIRFALLSMMTTIVSSQVPNLEVLCGQYSLYCASSCQTYQKQCAPTFGEIGITTNIVSNNNNNIPYPVITGNPNYAESNQHENKLYLELQPPSLPEKKNCKAKNGVCTTNKDCCLEFFCKYHHKADGHAVKIGTCQLPYYLDKIVPRGASESES